MLVVDIVKELLKFKETNVSAQDNDDFSALICAAGHGQVDIVKELLNENRTKVKVMDIDGFTASIAEMKRSHYDVV